MKFLVDRCAGHKLAEWLRGKGHDTLESKERGTDPGDHTILEWAGAEKRILITIDKDFGKLVFLDRVPHCGVIRMPDVPPNKRIELMEEILQKYSDKLEGGAIITIRRGRIRISHPQSSSF